MSKGDLKLKELLKRLKPYGIIALPAKRGKGSETILIRPDKEGSLKGPQYPIKNHGMGTGISVPVINAVLRRFSIDPKEFWNE